MSKYIYCNGKIYDRDNYAKLKIYLGEEIDGIDLKNKYRLVELPYEYENIKTVLEHMNSYIEFDNFEEIIEAGDLIGYRHIHSGKYSVSIYENTIFELSEFLHFEKIEIWKRIDNTFVRVCHKKDGKWVID